MKTLANKITAQELTSLTPAQIAIKLNLSQQQVSFARYLAEQYGLNTATEYLKVCCYPQPQSYLPAFGSTNERQPQVKGQKGPKLGYKKKSVNNLVCIFCGTQTYKYGKVTRQKQVQQRYRCFSCCQMYFEGLQDGA